MDGMEMIEGSGLLIGIVACGLGLISCYYGYKVFKIECGIIGFLIGFGLGREWTVAWFGRAEAAIIAGLVLGGLCALIAVKIYFVGVFLLWGGIVFSVAATEFGSPVAGLILGIILGIAGTVFAKYSIIIGTAISGGLAAGKGILSLFHQDAEQWPVLFGLIFIVLGTTGIVYQMRKQRSENG